jgi:hypothetical protein
LPFFIDAGTYKAEVGSIPVAQDAVDDHRFLLINRSRAGIYRVAGPKRTEHQYKQDKELNNALNFHSNILLDRLLRSSISVGQKSLFYDRLNFLLFSKVRPESSGNEQFSGTTINFIYTTAGLLPITLYDSMHAYCVAIELPRYCKMIA